MSMRRRLLTLLSLFFLGIVLTGCGDPKDLRLIPLDGQWEYSLKDPFGDNAEFLPVPDDAIPTLEKLIPGGVGNIWVRTKFVVPWGYGGEDLACFLGRVTMADITWVNNIYIGKGGRFPPHEFSAWNIVRNYTVPAKYLHAQENTLMLKIWVNGEGSLDRNMFIGRLDNVNTFANREDFWHNKVNLLFAFLMIIIAFYHFVIYLRRKKEHENLIFALLNLVSVFYIQIYFLNQLPGLPRENANFLWYQKIFSSGLPFFLPFLTTTYINAFLKRRDNRAIFCARLAFLVVPVLIVLVTPDYPHLHRITPKLMFLVVPPMIYAVVRMIISVIRKVKNSVLLMLAFSPLVLCLLFDLIVHNILQIVTLPYMTFFGWQMVIVTLLFLMANTFAASRNEAEYLNEHLEKEVADRTRELSESNTQLEAAKFRADRDMDLAVHVQRSFYMDKPPMVNGWDIAYIFQPMSGVSGDLYDFYVDGKELTGLGLFDISGHGIASGLVAMLAKVILDRKFKEGLNDPLNKVMDEINRDLVESKGDIENYMTGVLFRFRGNKVEYINAGHPRVFVRTAKDGKVVPVELPNSGGGEAGGLVGITGLLPMYKVIGFSLQPGDAMLIYTDSLYESRNIDGQEMTQDGVQKMFANVTGTSASAKLKDVINQFNTYVKGVPLRDDLTVIVLQKK